jgi:hypothetical protein
VMGRIHADAARLACSLAAGLALFAACRSPDGVPGCPPLSEPAQPIIQWASSRPNDSTVRIEGEVWHCGPLEQVRWFIETPESEGGVHELGLPWPVTFGELPGPPQNRLVFAVTLPARSARDVWAYGLVATGANGRSSVLFDEFYSGATSLQVELPGLPANGIVAHPGFELVLGLDLPHRLSTLEVMLNRGTSAAATVPLVDSAALGKRGLYATVRVWLVGPLQGAHTLSVRAVDEAGTVRDTTVSLLFTVPERAYDVVFLPAPAGTDVEPADINNHAVVAAAVRLADGRRSAAVWSNGHFAILEKPDSSDSSASAINDAGVVVGQIGTRAALWSNGGATLIEPGFVARDINSSGQILVSRILQEVLLREADGTLTTLASPIWCGDAARLNNLGRVVGTKVDLSSCYSSSATLLNPSEGVGAPPPFWPPLNIRGTRFAAGRFINDDGHVIGTIDGRWFLTRGPSTQFLATPFGDAAIVGLNNRNEVLARASDGTAYVWRIGAATHRVVIEPGWNLTGLVTINDQGQILGRALNSDGTAGAVVLSPR